MEKTNNLVFVLFLLLLQNWTVISYRCFRIFSISMLLFGDFLFSILKLVFWNNVIPKISIAAHLCGGISGLLAGLVVFKKLKSNSRTNILRDFAWNCIHCDSWLFSNKFCNLTSNYLNHFVSAFNHSKPFYCTVCWFWSIDHSFGCILSYCLIKWSFMQHLMGRVEHAPVFKHGSNSKRLVKSTKFANLPAQTFIDIIDIIYMILIRWWNYWTHKYRRCWNKTSRKPRQIWLLYKVYFKNSKKCDSMFGPSNNSQNFMIKLSTGLIL